VLHPVEARIEQLPNGYWLLVGADTSERANLRMGSDPIS
jgi:hypothetical protein